jgi:hypothetical protein
MPKERSINPVAAQHKLDKQKAQSKNKKNLQSRNSPAATPTAYKSKSTS